MPRHRLFLEARDLAVGQAGKVVEALVVFPDVVEAEPEILAFLHPADRRAMRAGFLAAVPLAGGGARFQLRVLVRADPNLLEIFRIRLHLTHLWEIWRTKQELTFSGTAAYRRKSPLPGGSYAGVARSNLIW